MLGHQALSPAGDTQPSAHAFSRHRGNVHRMLQVFCALLRSNADQGFDAFRLRNLSGKRPPTKANKGLRLTIAREAVRH